MAGIFNVDINRDGAYNVNGNWYSRATLVTNMPRQFFYNFGKMCVLAYITEEEYDLIIANFPDYITPSQYVGYTASSNFGIYERYPQTPFDVNTTQGQLDSLAANTVEFFNQIGQSVDFIGPQLPNPAFFGATQTPAVSSAPVYYIDGIPGAPVHRLVYITTEAQQFLIDTDFYGQDLANNNFVGPYGIPIYWGDPGSGPTGVGGGTGVGPSGSPSVDGGTCDAGSFSADFGYCGPGFSYGGPGDGYDGGTRRFGEPIFSGSGVYEGSLSSQGNMVAMQLNTEDFNTEVVNGQLVAKPYHEGYFKTYFRNPKGDIFGANTQMPALTGVMPEKYTDVPGNAVYYTDLQMYRMSGSNQWDQFYFINTFGQIVGWVLQCNNYLEALKKAEDTNLAYYGADSFQILTTQGFSKYQTGTALVRAFRNLGTMASLITAKNSVGQPYFGTANAVAEVLVDNGLGYINNLSTNLYAAGVNFDDIGNSLYTEFITDQLRQITNAADLETIQEVLGSSIPSIANPLDYTRIDRASGLPNDSEFVDFQAVGQDFVNRAPNLTLTNGTDIANLIDKIQSGVTQSVEDLAGTNTLLTQAQIDSLRSFLPFGANNEPITMLNVIGMSSGYQNVIMSEVNEGIAQLFATSYGPQIRDTFTEISRLSARLPLTTAEFSQSAATWDTQLENKKDEYYTLIDTIMADTTGNIPAIVEQINSNWDKFTSNLYYEFKNYNKANITAGNFGDNQTVFSFVQSMPGYAADQANIATDYMLYGLTQDNIGGEVARTVLDTGKNDNFLQQAGVTINSTL
jgi:hypothetical protein